MRWLGLLLLLGCTPTLDLDGPRRICARDGGCDEPTPDAAAEVDCEPACDRFAACAGECDGDPAPLIDSCRARCAADVAVAQALVEAPDCATVLEAGAPDQLAPCVGERCVRFGGRLTGCLVAECAAAGTVFEGLHRALTEECAAAVADGTLRLSTLDGLESDACSAAGWSERVAAAAAGDGPGALGPLCTTGPVLPADTCALSCDVAVACLDADAAPCRYGCATQPDSEPINACLAETVAGDCEAASACTQLR